MQFLQRRYALMQYTYVFEEEKEEEEGGGGEEKDDECMADWPSALIDPLLPERDPLYCQR